VAKAESKTQKPHGLTAGAPAHVAIIMDGNGRWAKKRLLPRQAGHVAGIAALRRIVRASRDFGITHLTVYAFSTENWSRPKAEVTGLMALFRRFFDADMSKLNDENVRVRFIGRREDLAGDIRNMIEAGEVMTKANTGFHLTIAFNYGAREEIVAAARALAEDAVAGKAEPAAITEDVLDARMQTAGFPPVDLVIRPGGEKRISNFLLWQAAYAELVFRDTLWPDFGADDLRNALDEFALRERRFGGLGPSAPGDGDAEAGAVAQVKQAGT